MEAKDVNSEEALDRDVFKRGLLKNFLLITFKLREEPSPGSSRDQMLSEAVEEILRICQSQKTDRKKLILYTVVVTATGLTAFYSLLALVLLLSA